LKANCCHAERRFRVSGIRAQSTDNIARPPFYLSLSLTLQLLVF
jgi:hypothetical protein